MENDNLIKIGDRVDLFWETVPALFYCEVLHVPLNSEDIWIVKDDKNFIHYVKNYCRITKRRNI